MKKTILLIILLMLPLVSAELETWYFDGNLALHYEENVIQLIPYGFNITFLREPIIIELFDNIEFKNCSFNKIPIEYLSKIRKIRVWDNHPKEGQPAGLYFLSNIIHIYDGCRNPDTLIHELAHLDRHSIKHDSFFWLSYYRIKLGR